uniref:Uncharacterized protein n=1 Tax=viral metagenome TaxID=1070528 RepID=A0A6M3LKE3_9ZZZZ
MAQSEVGQIRIFEDFVGKEIPIAGTADIEMLGDFKVGGEGFEDGTVGVLAVDSDGLSGIVNVNSGATDNDCTAIMTSTMFDVGLMGTLVMEVRSRFVDLDAKACFIGFSGTITDDMQLVDILDYSAATTVTLTAASICGFWYCSELTDDEDWHGVYKGGTTTGVTATGSIDLDADAVAGEFQILRLEIDNNGTARWYVDGVLKQTVVGAVSTTTDLAACVAIAANSGEEAVIQPDYILVTANRDWTV